MLAHLVGLCEDWVGGRFDGYASEEWTAAHLERHRGESCASLLETWRTTMTAFAEVDDSPLGATPARWAFGDAVVHEGDLRGATSQRSGPRDCGRTQPAGLAGPLAAGAATGRLGSRARGPARRPGALDGFARSRAGVEVEADLYEVFRGLAGRRSAAQVAGWSWSGDPSPCLTAGPPYPFRWARDPIVD